jgi:hypothetical protein
MEPVQTLLARTLDYLHGRICILPGETGRKRKGKSSSFVGLGKNKTIPTDEEDKRCPVSIS